jgi:hypothetical protein
MTLQEIASKRLTVVLIWLTLAVGSTYLYIFEPGKSGIFLICPFYKLTGLAAFRFNPLMMVMLPLLLFALIRHTHAVMRGRPIKGNQLPANYIWLLFFVVLSFWIFRNTPLYPFPI